MTDTDEIFDYITEDSVSESKLEETVRETVIEEMEKAEVHPKQVETDVNICTDEIRSSIKNVNTDEELESIEKHLSIIEEEVQVQKEFHDEVREDEMDAVEFYRQMYDDDPLNSVVKQVSANITVGESKNE